MSEDAGFRNLLDRVRAGDSKAALELVRGYEWAIRLQVRVRLTQPDLRRLLDSMDIVQRVWMSFFPRVIAGQYELEDPRKLLNLLITLSQNKLLDEARRLRRQRRGQGQVADGLGAANEPIDPRPGPEQVVDDRDFVREFRQRLAPPEQWVWDQRLQGRAWAEIAAERGTDPDVLRIGFNRAVERVTRQMADGLDT
jgi:DNA-directed RNA polymerase specialized sigma24 family protein